MAGTPATTRVKTALLERLTTLCAVGDVSVDVAEAALVLSALRRPDFDPASYRDHMAALCAEVGVRAQRGHEPPDALRAVLVEGYAYQGDRETYDDLQNADLASVIDRRRGLPVALSLIWLHAARAQGWACVGVAFPGHFLVLLDAAGTRTVLDPFNDGAVLEPPDLRRLLKTVHGADAELRPQHVATMSDQDVLLRLENNIKVRQIRDGDVAGATSTLERMTAIAPDRSALWFEAGALNAQIDAVGAACRAFDRFLAVDAENPPSDEVDVSAARAKARRDATALLRELRRRLN
ncbi:MAG TPA: transglutaminase-like domain-containing protein [Vineibacter sp.]|nr:transglutaminase-like domain-containing protein [Vineibacter sp.]